MFESNRVSNLIIPSPADAVQLYTSNGGHLSVESTFGIDPLPNNYEKQTIRQQSVGNIGLCENVKKRGIIINYKWNPLLCTPCQPICHFRGFALYTEY